MGDKDSVAIIFSLMSIVFSVITLIRSMQETNRTVRGEITEILGKLNTVASEAAKLRKEHPDDLSTPYVEGMRVLLNEQRRYLARQADYLLGHTPSLKLSDVEYGMIAGAFQNLGDFARADTYYRLALDYSTDDLYRSMELRGYARNLFNQQRYDEGRQQYKKAIRLTPPDHERNIYNIGETYQRWAAVEAEFNFTTNARELLLQSRAAFEQLQNEGRRRDRMSSLERQEKGIANVPQQIQATAPAT